MIKSIFSAAVIAVIAAVFFVGCGGNGDGKQSALVGHWEYVSGVTENKYENMELFRDGTGVLDGGNISWKIENKRLVILSSRIRFDCNYKISDYELTLDYDDGSSAIFVRKERMKEFAAAEIERAKRVEQEEAERAKQSAIKAKPYVEKAKQNMPQIEKLLEEYFVYVDGGTFRMGCTSEQGADCGYGEKPTHSVTVSDFQIGKYEITQKLWELTMGNNPSKFKGDNLPVESVSWDDIQIFISALNILTDKKYRLPTEAEWEYAARGGNKSQRYVYSGSNNSGYVAWYSNNSGSRTHQVGQKKPNELGIYDMSGNVYEWCSDWYGAYSSGAVTNPAGAAAGIIRVIRGGSWYYVAQNCRVAYRNGNDPSYSNHDIGFRIAADK